MLEKSCALIVGLRASGLAAYHLLQKKGWKVKLFDDDKSLMATLPETVSGQDRDAVLNGVTLLITSPGVPSEHPLLAEAKKRKIHIMSELQFGLDNVSQPYVMVTGTNGKTTVVKMIEKLLKLSGKKVKAVGNVGYPVCQFAMDNENADYLVVEASSFQLEFIHSAKPLVAVFTNLQPDHMDRYASFKDYMAAKARILKNQTTEDFVVFNAEDARVEDICSRCAAQKRPIALNSVNGKTYVKDRYFYFDDKPIASFKEAKAKGEHNRFNLLTALTVGEILGVKRENAISLIKEYKPLPHRVEYVTTIDGKRFYNDSKGTNIAATESAIGMLNGNIGLILGGSDKNEDYYEFFERLSPKVKYITATGTNAEKIISCAYKVGFTSIVLVDTLELSIRFLADKKVVDTVLFSPASASFDRYKNYEERGNVFKQLVYRLKA